MVDESREREDGERERRWAVADYKDDGEGVPIAKSDLDSPLTALFHRGLSMLGLRHTAASPSNSYVFHYPPDFYHLLPAFGRDISHFGRLTHLA